MNWYERLSRLSLIKDALQDKASEDLFYSRLDYMMDRNAEKYRSEIQSLIKEWHCLNFESFWEKYNFDGIIIFGCGNEGKITKEMLNCIGYTVDYYCDNDKAKQGTKVKGVSVISVEEAVMKCPNFLFIPGTQIYAEEMYQLLLEKGVLANHIFYHENCLHGCFVPIRGVAGEQYRDVFLPEKEEVIVDAGSFDGETVIEFAEWTKHNYKKIYAIEPNQDMLQMVKDRCKNLQNIEYCQNAVWDKEEILFFDVEESRKAAAKIKETGKLEVQGRDIDSIVGDTKVTYIKMDVEGSELKALYGAKKTILRDKPKLAISIYHKLDDIVDIPLYILELVPEYKFHIRCYYASGGEMVLYASV